MKKTYFLICFLAGAAALFFQQAVAETPFPNNISTETTPKGQITRLQGDVTFTEDEVFQRSSDTKHYSDGAFCVGTHLGDGSMTVANGVNLQFSNSLYAGGKGYGSTEAGAGNGTINVGKGSVITVGINTYSSGGHHIDIGNSGSDITGTLNINGGMVNSTQAVIGMTKALGVVNICNDGVLNLTLEHVNDTVQTDFVAGSDKGTARISLDNGHIISSTGSQTFIGYNGGKAEVELVNGSSWESTSLVFAGYGCTQESGYIHISGDSSFTANSFYLYNTMKVENKGVMRFDSTAFIMGGAIECTNGATLTAPYLSLHSGATGSLVLSGSGTTGNAGSTIINVGSCTVSDGAKLKTGALKIQSDAVFALENGGSLLLDGNILLNGKLNINHASHTIQEGQIVQTSDGSSRIHLMDKGTLVNYGTMNTYGDGVEMVINPEGGSRFQTGTMRVTGRGPLDDDANDIKILSYNTGLQGNVKVALPSSGTVSLGSVLEGVNAAGTEYELQKIYLRDYDKINDKLMEGLGLSEAPRNNIRFDYETRHVILVLSTDEVNMHDGTHTVSVAEGSGVIIENGGSYKEETKVGTIGSYSSDGGNTTEADIRVSEAASAQGGMQSSVEWHGSSLETISGEDTTLTDGVTLTMTDKTQGEEQIGPGTLKVKKGSSLTNNGTIKANTVVETAAALKGSGTMGKTDVKGSLVVGNSPGHPSYTGDLTLYDSSDTTFSVAGLDTASSGENIGWESNTYSHITMLGESKLILPEKVHLTVEFGGESIYTLGGYHEAKEFSFNLQLVTGGVMLPIELSTLSPNAEGFYDITNLVTVAFTVTNDAAAGIYTAANMDVVVDSHQFLVESDGNGGAVNLHLVGHGTVSVPEPMTGTLSLLALAALVARRRRH